MNKTEEQSGMTMEQMEEAGKIEEKKRDAEAAVAQSEAASKKRREGKVLIYEDDLELLDKFCGVKGLDILDHRMEELPESRSATTIVGDFSLELLLKAIREANPGCFVTGKQVHGKVCARPYDEGVPCAMCGEGPASVAIGRGGSPADFAGERSEQFENVPGKTVIVLRPAGCRSVADVMRWFATSGLTAPDQIKLKDRDLDSGRWDGLRPPHPDRRADVSLSPGWTECFASEVGPRLILRISDIWPPEMPKLLGMWPLILLRLVKGSLVIVLSFPGMGLMGAPMPASAQNLRMNGQLWTTTGGDARAGQGVNGQTRTPLTPAAVPAGAGEEGAAGLRRRDALGIVTPGVARERVEDNLAKMWQANLTEWYEENPDGDNLKKEENPDGDNLKKEENPDGDNLKKEENPAVGDNLKGHRWATPAGWGMDTMEENPKKGDNLKKEENPAVGDNLKGHRWATSAGWGTDTEEENPKGDNLKKEENPAEGDNLMREGAEENPDFGENLDGGMEDDAGDGNAAQAGDIGGILLWLRWLGLASFLLTTPLSFGSALGTGRFGKGDWLGYHGCK
ncbi:hypothetical protein PAPYR_12688 [Paratrimastix pyriformis]|uniref:Uncharacterized protein n=1 Tax=Paratrimastix pyriformis TaxID=342808 RepID=A0ABQ8U574_9EUKA|nr:hypothetical protein PAPYR_12688 [Paratrimastix pyriformis]